MLDIRKRTGFLFFGVMLAQVILVSAQVQSKTGVRVLQAGHLRAVLARASAAASASSAGRATCGGITWRCAGCATRTRRCGGRCRTEIQLQEEHALAARSRELQALMDLKTHAALPTLAAEVIGGNPNPDMRTITIDRGSADGVQADMAVIAPAGIVGRVIGPPARHAAARAAAHRPQRGGRCADRADARRRHGRRPGRDPAAPDGAVSNLADVKDGDASSPRASTGSTRRVS